MSDAVVEHLIENGYYVFPTFDYTKQIGKINQRPWSWYVDHHEQDLLAEYFYMHHEARSGAALCPRPTDPTPLIVVDVQAGLSEPEQAWAALNVDAPLKDEYGVVRTCSGNLHFWMSLPEGINPDKLPASFDLGGGVIGELRASRKDPAFIMLPGSHAINSATGEPGTYEELQSIDPDRLADAPMPLMRRMVNRMPRRSKHARDHQREPVDHALALLSVADTSGILGPLDALEHAGFLLGRSLPRERPNDALRAELWRTVTRHHNDLDPDAFNASVNRGWDQGAQSAIVSGPTTTPNASEMLSEAESIFGYAPWMVEVRDATGTQSEILIGLGGSATRRHDAKAVRRIKSERDILPTLASMANVHPDTIIHSPLWPPNGPGAKALIFYLRTFQSVEYVGMPPERKFWQIVTEWALEAARSGRMLEKPQGWRQIAEPNECVLIWQANRPPTLFIPPALQDSLLSRCNSIATAKKLVDDHFIRKAVKGMRQGVKAWWVFIEKLPKEVQDEIIRLYEAARAAKREADGRARGSGNGQEHDDHSDPG